VRRLPGSLKSKLLLGVQAMVKRSFCYPTSLFLALTTLFAGAAFAAVVGTAEKLTGPRPAVISMGNRYVAPTEDLTKVANAVALHTYSLTTQVTVRSGLALTQPVRITVRFTSYSGSAFSDVVEQIYDNTNGNRLVVNDQEGLGTLRQGNVRIELFEFPPGWTGGRVEGTGSFDLPDMRVNLDPLYYVAVGPLRVSRQDNCVLWNSPNQMVRWFSPDNQIHEKPFQMRSQTTAMITGTEWVNQEVSAAKNYHVPNVGLYGFFVPSAPSGKNLIPAPLMAGRPMPTQEIKIAMSDSARHCNAFVQYVINRQIRRGPPVLTSNLGAQTGGKVSAQ
jgi:hypothetical protein